MTYTRARLADLETAIVALESRRDLAAHVDDLCDLALRLDRLASRVSSEVAAARAQARAKESISG